MFIGEIEMEGLKKKKDKKLLRQYLVTYIIVLMCKNNNFSYGFLCQFFEI